MSLKLLSGLARLSPGFKTRPAAFCTAVSGKTGRFEVRHDRENQRFTVAPDDGEGQEAVLSYRFTGDQQVELMSTFVPEAFRERGLAALLSEAALDFLVEEQLTAQVSCWYINKYLQKNPKKKYTELIRS
ncbi:protein NATD1-like [Boleophthalmus pectinirostris]|uniref:protein NATD1-like n=1 Tax=Boleophthalmus pectinirostris TaxID=150288 RepID=UPI00242FCF27|nr:protein NATD1-like [Boleophthalmus pectinirostris]